jgi:hypothetical protein
MNFFYDLNSNWSHLTQKVKIRINKAKLCYTLTLTNNILCLDLNFFFIFLLIYVMVIISHDLIRNQKFLMKSFSILYKHLCI